MLRCPPALVPRSTVQRLFDAAATDGKAGEPSAGQERPQVPGHIEPGMAFWRLVLLVSCYVEVFVAFCPSDGFNARIPPDEFARLAGFLCRWGVPAVSARQASEEAVQLFGRAARWDQLLEWGMERLGEAIQQGAAPSFDISSACSLERRTHPARDRSPSRWPSFEGEMPVLYVLFLVLTHIDVRTADPICRWMVE